MPTTDTAKKRKKYNAVRKTAQDKLPIVSSIFRRKLDLSFDALMPALCPLCVQLAAPPLARVHGKKIAYALRCTGTGLPCIAATRDVWLTCTAVSKSEDSD